MGIPGDRGDGQEDRSSGGWQSEWQSGGWQSQWQQPGSEAGWRQEQAPQQQQPASSASGWHQNPDGSWAMAGPQASGKATAALVLGVLGFVFCPIIFSVLALVFGHQGRNEIDGSGGRISGRGLATAGIILGWTGIVIWGLLIALGVLGAIVGDGSTGGGGAPAGVPA
jgi:hypothetical protein